MGFIPDDWLHGLDYSTLEKVPGSYVSDDFQQREDDIIWKVKVGEDWVYLYLLIEFQSRVDKYMALRIMVYIGLLYQDLIKRGDVLAEARLPPILPIVLYNGKQRWTSVTDVADLIPVVPGLVEQFKLTLSGYNPMKNSFKLYPDCNISEIEKCPQKIPSPLTQ